MGECLSKLCNTLECELVFPSCWVLRDLRVIGGNSMILLSTTAWLCRTALVHVKQIYSSAHVCANQNLCLHILKALQEHQLHMCWESKRECPFHPLYICTVLLFSLSCHFSFFDFCLLFSNIQELVSCVQTENSPVKTIQAVLVWVCCLNCLWDNGIWSSKSGWSNRLLCLKAYQKITAQRFVIFTGWILQLWKLARFNPAYKCTHVEHVCVRRPR